MLGLYLVSVYPTATLFVKDRVARVKIELLEPGAEREHLVDVSHKLLGCASATGVVTRGLNSARESSVSLLVKSANVVTLPAVERDRNAAQLCYCRIGVDTEGCVFLLCVFVSCHMFTSFISKEFLIISLTSRSVSELSENIS